MNKLLPALVLAFTAVASAPVLAASPDQDRRDSNREEALSKWRADHRDLASTSGKDTGRRSTMRQKAHNGAESVRGFTHRQAEKVRNKRAADKTH